MEDLHFAKACCAWYTPAEPIAISRQWWRRQGSCLLHIHTSYVPCRGSSREMLRNTLLRLPRWRGNSASQAYPYFKYCKYSLKRGDTRSIELLNINQFNLDIKKLCNSSSTSDWNIQATCLALHSIHPRPTGRVQWKDSDTLRPCELAMSFISLDRVWHITTTKPALLQYLQEDSIANTSSTEQQAAGSRNHRTISSVTQ